MASAEGAKRTGFGRCNLNPINGTTRNSCKFTERLSLSLRFRAQLIQIDKSVNSPTFFLTFACPIAIPTLLRLKLLIDDFGQRSMRGAMYPREFLINSRTSSSLIRNLEERLSNLLASDSGRPSFAAFSLSTSSLHSIYLQLIRVMQAFCNKARVLW